MKSVVLILAFACAFCMQAVAPAVAQESAQTVKAAIPPQTVRPAPVPTPAKPVEAPAPAPAPAPDLDGIANVRVDVVISYQVGQGALVKRSASLMVAHGESGSLRAGNQVAVPSTTFTPAVAAARAEANPGVAPPTPTPMTSFNYRSVGLNVDARRVRVSGNKAKMDLSVEFSAIDDKASDPAAKGDPIGRMPSFPTFSQNLSLVLESGRPVIIAQTSDVVDNVERKQSVEVKATIIR